MSLAPIPPYCATCDHEFEPALNPTLQGRRFECPCGHRDEQPHIAVVGRNRWHRHQVLLARWMRLSRSRVSAGSRLVGETIAALASLVATRLFPLGWLTVPCAVATALILDQLLYNAAVVFTVARPRNALRTVVLAIWGILVFCLAFAALDAAASRFGGFGEKQLTAVDAAYFSVVVFATVGFGDVSPSLGRGWAQLLASAQILTGLFLLAIVVANFAAWAVAPPRQLTLTELIAESERLDLDARTHARCRKPDKPGDDA